MLSTLVDRDPTLVMHRKKMEQDYGPESGMAVVGKLLPLNANANPYNNSVAAHTNMLEVDNHLDYFHESEVTFGETSCSFGLTYNDHNYACPLGLSPPSSPPHLRDLKFIPFTENCWTDSKFQQQMGMSVPFVSSDTKPLNGGGGSSATNGPETNYAEEVVSTTDTVAAAAGASKRTASASPIHMEAALRSSRGSNSSNKSNLNSMEPVMITSGDVGEEIDICSSSSTGVVVVDSTSTTSPLKSRGHAEVEPQQSSLGEVAVASSSSSVTAFIMQEGSSALLKSHSNATNMCMNDLPMQDTMMMMDTTNLHFMNPSSAPGPLQSNIPPRMPQVETYSRSLLEPLNCYVYDMPEHLAVSPSQLSDLESDADDLPNNNIYCGMEDEVHGNTENSEDASMEYSSVAGKGNKRKWNKKRHQQFHDSYIKRARAQAAQQALLPWKSMKFRLDQISDSSTAAGATPSGGGTTPSCRAITSSSSDFIAVVNCICGGSHVDDAMVTCTICNSWQHFDCVIAPKDSRVYYMNNYRCPQCAPQPFPLDMRRAQLIQRAKLRSETIPAHWLHELRLLPEKEVAAMFASHHSNQNVAQSLMLALSGGSGTGVGGGAADDEPCRSESEASSVYSSSVATVPPPPPSSAALLPSLVSKTLPEVKVEEVCEKDKADDIPKDDESKSDNASNKPSRRKQDLSGQRQFTRTDAGANLGDSPHKRSLDAAGALKSSLESRTASKALFRSLGLDPLMVTPGSPAKRGRRRLIPRTADETYIRGSSMETLTNPLGTAWMKDYTPIDCNLYSDDVLHHVRENREFNPSLISGMMQSLLMRKPMCRIVIFDHNYKGLEASGRILPGESIIEFRGKVMLKEEYEILKDPIADFNRYVLFYRKFNNITIAVDAAECGNEARYIRRSCRPNCDVRHHFVNDDLHFHIVSISELLPGMELTIPFDYDYTTCRHHVECACGTSRCPVHRWIRSVQTRRAIPKLDYSKYIKNQLRALSQPLTDMEPHPSGSQGNVASPTVSSSGLLPYYTNRPGGLKKPSGGMARYGSGAGGGGGGSSHPRMQSITSGSRYSDESHSLVDDMDEEEEEGYSNHDSASHTEMSGKVLIRSTVAANVNIAASGGIGNTDQASSVDLEDEVIVSVKTPVKRKGNEKSAATAASTTPSKRKLKAALNEDPDMPPFESIITTRRQRSNNATPQKDVSAMQSSLQLGRLRKH